MGQEQFVAMMSYISTDLVNKIAENQKISDVKALEKLYSSKLYEFLEQEDTKVWQYSTDMLYHLFSIEEKTGTISFPDI